MGKAAKIERSTTAGIADERPCRHCRADVGLTAESLAQIVNGYLKNHKDRVVDDGVYSSRLAACRTCNDLLYGCTCRHCGCFVQVMAKLAGKACPSPRGARWGKA